MESDSDWRGLCPSFPNKHLHLLNSKIFSDVVFLVGDTKERIHAHKLILVVASPVFEAQFGERWEQENEIEIPDVSPTAFQMFLEYLYADKFSVTENEAADVLFLAHKYLTTCLAKKCSDLLASVINISNVIHIHQIATKYNEKKLKMKSMEFILKNGSAVIDDIGFLQIDVDTLNMILESEELVAEEIEIFRAVMRWAENRCKVERIVCSVKNKRIVLKNLIYLIPFALMSLEDFTNEVASGQHEGILSESEYMEIYYNYLTAGSSLRLPSDVQNSGNLPTNQNPIISTNVHALGGAGIITLNGQVLYASFSKKYVPPEAMLTFLVACDALPELIAQVRSIIDN